MTNILVLDGNQRSALSVVRSLGNLNLNLITSDDSIRSLAGESKYVTKNIQSPSAKLQPNEFITWFNQVVELENIGLAFPVTEITSQLLVKYQLQLSSKVRIPFASLETIMKLADKSQLMKLAETLDVKHPGTRYFSNIDDLDISSEVNFPLVFKPAQSRIYLGDRWVETTVRILYSKQDLERLVEIKEESLNFPFMLQEYIPGSGAGVFAIYDNGQEKAFFAHKRLREKPPSGGVSVLCESAELNPEMLSAARKILDKVDWHGVAMVEFRVSEEGVPYLMEVNTRFWGSLQLAIDSGVDFPRMLYQIMQCDTIEPLKSYKIGQQLRWLLGDIDSLYIALKDKNYKIGFKLKRIVEFLRPKFSNRRFEINRLSDLGPAWFELKQYINDIIR